MDRKQTPLFLMQEKSTKRSAAPTDCHETVLWGKEKKISAPFKEWHGWGNCGHASPLLENSLACLCFNFAVTLHLQRFFKTPCLDAGFTSSNQNKSEVLVCVNARQNTSFSLQEKNDSIWRCYAKSFYVSCLILISSNDKYEVTQCQCISCFVKHTQRKAFKTCQSFIMLSKLLKILCTKSIPHSFFEMV